MSRASATSASMPSALAARSEWIARPESTSGRPAAAMFRAAAAVSSADARKRRWFSRSGASKPKRS
jgi:hypothetical protein